MDQTDAANGVQTDASDTAADLAAENAQHANELQAGAEEPAPASSKKPKPDVFDRDLDVVEFGIEHFLASVEDDGRKLLLKLKSIPSGIHHGWHTLVAELESRIKLT